MVIITLKRSFALSVSCIVLFGAFIGNSLAIEPDSDWDTATALGTSVESSSSSSAGQNSSGAICAGDVSQYQGVYTCAPPWPARRGSGTEITVDENGHVEAVDWEGSIYESTARLYSNTSRSGQITCLGQITWSNGEVEPAELDQQGNLVVGGEVCFRGRTPPDEPM
jgi:hypothetical protein